MEKRHTVGRKLLGAMLLVVAGTGFVRAEQSGCPEVLQTWRMFGQVESDGEWGAEILEIRGDVGVLRELQIRFLDGALTPEQARWFDAPSMVVPDIVRARTLSFVGDELQSHCRRLVGSGLDSMREQARARCLVTAGGHRMVVRGTLALTDAEMDPSRRFANGGIGLLVGGREVDEGDLECELVDDLVSTFEQITDSGTRPTAVDAVYEMLEAMIDATGAVESGLAAVPTARHVIAVLREHAADGMPESLPSQLSLMLSAASGSHAEALALEGMLDGEDSDELLALKWLGEFATSTSIPLLQLKLRENVAENRGQVAGLTLRAMLMADPRVARLEAVPLLIDPTVVRHALGVFALSDPILADDLESLDTTDPEALAEAGRRILSQLASTASEEELRLAAVKLAAEALDNLELRY